MSVCPDCTGRGWLPPDYRPCTRCGGIGDVCDGPERICERCDGIGSLYDVPSDTVVACAACESSGLVLCREPVLRRESAERAWCPEHRPGTSSPPHARR